MGIEYASMLLVVFMLLFGLFVLLLSVGLYYVSRGKLLVKAGEPWWKILIPIYSSYIFAKISRGLQWFFLRLLIVLLFIIVVFVLSVALNEDLLSLAINIAVLVFGLLLIVCRYMSLHCLARSFGKDYSYSIGLFFFEEAFMLVLAFGNAKYCYPERGED